MTATPRSAPAAYPIATYRLQLSHRFDFAAAAALAPYLRALGVSDLYASPILRARTGSLHGYDGVDPTRLNPELGGDAGFARLHQALDAHGLRLLLDIVPNHLCVVGGENPWWQDVLTHGRGSPHATVFDIDWAPAEPALRGRVLLPLLGAPLEQVLSARELRVVLERGAPHMAYYDHRWPLALASWPLLLRPLTRARHLPPAPRAAVRVLLTALRRFAPPPRMVRALAQGLRAAAAEAPRQLTHLLEAEPALAAALAAELAVLNAEAGAWPNGGRWPALLAGQAWLPAYWQEAGQRLNYRRFFDITELAGLRQEAPGVFAATHSRVLALVREGAVHGLRIDHPDGLADPAGYLRRLRRALHTAGSRPGYVVVEKILDPGERRRGDWPVEGGTGYDLLFRLNAVQVKTEHAAAFRAVYARCAGDAESIAEHVHEGKRGVLRFALAGELERLASRLQALAAMDEAWRAVTLDTCRAALEALAACLPVYRTYVTHGGPASDEDRHWIAAAVAEARRRHGALDPALLDWLAALWTHPARALPRARREAQSFVTRWQQLTSAATAKGMEDTAFYRYVPLISLNEVGGDPGQFGIPRRAFHAWSQARAQRWPHALSATATHDTKRGEGVRSRINVLSEIPAQWEAAFQHWQSLNAPHRAQVEGQPVPEPGTEYLLYQTLVGAWPLAGRADPDWADFPGRIAAYLIKAVREAKRHTSWTAPNAAYEDALKAFTASILAPEPASAFPAALEGFLRPLLRPGLYNALAQTLFKLSLPGVPDVYQGTELWDFSLVDPDNRRPVDFIQRQALLAALPEQPTPALAQGLLADAVDGRILFHLLRQGLALRQRRPALFGAGDYRPLDARGERERHVVAFARVRGRSAAVVAAGRFFLGLPGAQDDPPALPVGPVAWGDTVLHEGEGKSGLSRGPYRDLLSGQILRPQRAGRRYELPLAVVFAHLPVALLERVA